jgi:hypothetical protein
LAGAEGYYKVQRGLCILHIVTLDANGKIKDTIRYEKKSTAIQPDVKNPNSDFKGTIITSLSSNKTDIIDVSTSKTLSTFSSNASPNSGLSAFTSHIYKDKYYDDNEIYPNLEILNDKGIQIYKYKGFSKNGVRWAVGEYWYGVPSPDGTKIALTGKYILHNGILDPNYVKPYPIVSVIDLKNGNELKWFESDAQNNWAATWTPKGELIMPKKGGGINLISSNLEKTTTISTKSISDARVNINNVVLFFTSVGFFTMNIDGSNINPIPEIKFKVLPTGVYDMCWGPDGKSFGVLYKDPNLSEYNILLAKSDGSKYTYFNDSKGDYLVLKSPVINWR